MLAAVRARCLGRGPSPCERLPRGDRRLDPLHGGWLSGAPGVDRHRTRGRRRRSCRSVRNARARAGGEGPAVAVSLTRSELVSPGRDRCRRRSRDAPRRAAREPLATGQGLRVRRAASRRLGGQSGRRRARVAEPFHAADAPPGSKPPRRLSTATESAPPPSTSASSRGPTRPSRASARASSSRAKGRHAEADAQLARALAFYRSVRATRYLQQGEALLTASA